jgi:hypothetical protein
VSAETDIGNSQEDLHEMIFFVSGKESLVLKVFFVLLGFSFLMLYFKKKILFTIKLIKTAKNYSIRKKQQRNSIF